MIGFGITDIGKIRQKNEDSVYFTDLPIGNLDNLYIVADGMGGHKAGQVASSTAIEVFVSYIEKHKDCTDEPLDMLIGAVNSANEAVYKLSFDYPEYEGMGTTIVAATIKDGFAYIAHVGDSRFYKISKGEIVQVTNDHSLVAEMVRAGEITPEEARVHHLRNCITRAVGTSVEVSTDGMLCKLEKGDTVVLCSDGLYTMLEDSYIASIAGFKECTPEQRATKLVEEANFNGGNDNITAIVVDID